MCMGRVDPILQQRGMGSILSWPKAITPAGGNVYVLLCAIPTESRYPYAGQMHTNIIMRLNSNGMQFCEYRLLGMIADERHKLTYNQMIVD